MEIGLDTANFDLQINDMLDFYAPVERHDLRIAHLPTGNFAIQLNSLDPALASHSTQEQQYEIAGFVFKEPRIKTALVDATVSKSLTRTIENIEKSFKNFYYKDQILSIFTNQEITNYKIIIP